MHANGTTHLEGSTHMKGTTHMEGTTHMDRNEHTEYTLWRAVRWPLLILAVAALGIAAATILDETSARELALVVGAPALTLLLPVGLALLVISVIRYALHRRGAGSSR